MKSQEQRWYRAALLFSAVFHAVHVLALPVLISFDGFLYIRSAEILGTGDFAGEWDFLRTPIFPLLLKISFSVFGKQPLAIIVVNSSLGFGGIWALASALKRTGYLRAAIALVVTLTLWPYAVAYEHCALTESGSFFFIALTVWTLTVPFANARMKTAALLAVLIGGYYFRPTLLYLSPVAAVLHAVILLKSETIAAALPRNRRIRTAAVHALLITILPFAAAKPWNRQLDNTGRRGEVLVFNLILQAVIPPDDPRMAPVAEQYESAIRKASASGRLNYSGIGSDHALGIIHELHKRHAALPGGATFADAVTKYPARYVRGVGRSLLVYAGLGGSSGENLLFANKIFAGAGSQFFPGPPELEERLGSLFTQPPSPSLISNMLQLLTRLFVVLTWAAWVATFALLCYALWNRDFVLLSFGAIPLAFAAMHALILASIDRYAFPANALMFANLCIAGELCIRPQATPVSLPKLNLPHDRKAFAVFAALLAALIVMHTYYHSASNMTPSWDEAHYISGSHRVAEGFRAGTLHDIEEGYYSALRTKAPLICVPAGLLMLICGDGIFPAMLSLVLIFWLLGLASYSLFRNLFPPAFAAVAASLLITMPMITGLTHRLYVENLFLLCAVVYLDLLIRFGWRSFASAGLLGVALGLGVLAKFPFPILLFAPSIYVLAIELRKRAGLRDAGLLASKCAVTLIAALVISGGWYARNWDMTVGHASAAANSPDCDYSLSGWILSIISCGPSFPIFLTAAAGFIFWTRYRKNGVFAEYERKAWDCILLLALSFLLLNTISSNKATRLMIGWLPAMAALATFALIAAAKTPQRALKLGLAAISFSLLVCAHNSFGILPVPPVRIGDLIVLDKNYPLNVPNWFQDNHPLDRRDFRTFYQVADGINRDAAARFPFARVVNVGLTADSLVLGHDYLQLHSEINKARVVYYPNYLVSFTGTDTPHYVIQPRGIDGIFPGSQYSDLFPEFESLAAAAKLPYEKAFEMSGPDGTGLTVYRRKNQFSRAQR